MLLIESTHDEPNERLKKETSDLMFQIRRLLGYLNKFEYHGPFWANIVNDKCTSNCARHIEQTGK